MSEPDFQKSVESVTELAQDAQKSDTFVPKDLSKSNENMADTNENDLEETNSQDETQEPKPFSYIEMLDAPRNIYDPVNITLEYLKEISDELGLIKLCWPDISDVAFEDRTNFPESYLKNTKKEKLLLLYAENFRRQFCFKYPKRKPLFLACDNECGMQKMVCTKIRPTTLPYSEIETWEECSKFVADHLNYEPLEVPTLIVRRNLTCYTMKSATGALSVKKEK